jgi:hypothetical protein
MRRHAACKCRTLLLLAVGLGILLWVSSSAAEQRQDDKRLTLFIGVDVSGSFTNTPHFKDSLSFLSYYIYGHLNGVGGLQRPRALFVGSVGGESPNEPKTFFPIHEFQRKSVPEIQAKLAEIFTVRGDRITDFNTFFRKVSEVVRKQNLILTPLAVVIVSDGIPDVPGTAGKELAQETYKAIDVSPLEYLARNVTVRLLYPSPKVGNLWERSVPRQRVRIWPVESQVMAGWTEQLQKKARPEEEDLLWKWVRDIVDFRVRRQIL